MKRGTSCCFGHFDWHNSLARLLIGFISVHLVTDVKVVKEHGHANFIAHSPSSRGGSQYQGAGSALTEPFSWRLSVMSVNHLSEIILTDGNCSILLNNNMSLFSSPTRNTTEPNWGRRKSRIVGKWLIEQVF